MKKSHISTLTLLVLGASILSGCRAKNSLPGAGNPGGNPTDALPVPKPAPSTPFQVSARAKKAEFAVGKPVELQIEIKNVSDKTQTLQFSSGQSFNFSATREGEKDTAWNWAMDKMFTQALRSQPLEAGKSLKFDATWENATPGRYLVTGSITANGGLDAAPFLVIVK
ncbi:MAG TPA: BsuPI-related putative proteinase inhibitor [Abditibacterium sp.]